MQPRELSFTHRLKSLDDYAELKQKVGGQRAAKNAQEEEGDVRLRDAPEIIRTLLSDADLKKAAKHACRVLTQLI